MIIHLRDTIPFINQVWNHQNIVLQISQKDQKPTISTNYVVYLQKSKFDSGMSENQLSISQAIRGSDSSKQIDAIENELKSMNQN